MKNNIIKSGLVLLFIIQVTLFIAKDYIIIKKEIEPKSIEVTSQKNLEIYDVVNEIQNLKGFQVNEIINENECYRITGEIKGKKEEIEKMLKSINYFGIISYTINVHQEAIDLDLTLEERLNNNCI